MAGMKSLVLACMVVCAACEDEPRCSKYHFEEKVLEKLVRMEFVMEHMKAEMLDATNLVQKVKASVDDKLTDMDRTKDDLKASVDDKLTEMGRTKDDLIKNVQTHLEKAEPAKQPTVVFKARSNGVMEVPRNKIIVLPTVILNIGGGYDSNTGMFTAPVNGTYLFTTAFCVYNKQYLNAGLMMDGTKYSAMTFYADAGITCHSGDTVAVLTVNQKVYIEELGSSSSGNVLVHSDNRWNTFSGVLISS